MRLPILIIALFLTQLAISQVPQKISFQAVVRKADQSLVKSTQVGVQTSILQGNPFGNMVFSEVYFPNPTTNANGLLTLSIGSGAPLLGPFLSEIDWSAGPYFVMLEIDPNGGTDFTITVTSELLSVPYALYAANGAPGPQGPAGPQGDPGPQGPQGTFTAGTAPGQMLYWNGSEWKLVEPGTTGLILNYCDGVPTWGPCPDKVPVLTTNPVSCMNANSGIGGGKVLLVGGSPVIKRGICWGVNPQPTLADNFTSDGTGLGEFVSIFNNLSPNTTYYYRAYATNNLGTGYGNEYSFTTGTDTIVQVGCYYKGGIVAYILQNGDPGYDPNVQHGIIVAPFDQGTIAGVPWGCYEYPNFGTSKAIGSGKLNTELIVSNCSDNYTAARLCYDLILNGYDDWCLPSYDETGKLAQYNNLFGGFPPDPYWTSTENIASIYAYVRFIQGGNIAYFNRESLIKVRAIRYF